MTVMISALFAGLGLCFGSFVNALVWRLHEERDFVRERSECVHCHHALAWYDLVPVLSWLGLKGKCRYCKKPISVQYPLVELATAGVFMLSYVAWPYELATVAEMTLLGLWLIMVVLLMALLVYDARWYLLPDKLMFPLIGVALIFGLIRLFVVEGMTIGAGLLDLSLGILAVGGLYYTLYKVSRGAWVGFGDVKLGIAMGLILGGPLALLSVFLANIIGLLMVLPGMMSGKLSSKSRIPFGPFLIAGLLVSLLWGEAIIAWYLGIILSV